MRSTELDAWKVWHRPDGRTPWRVVGAAANKVAAAKLMFDLMAGGGNDWLVTAPDAPSPNVRPAHLRR